MFFPNISKIPDISKLYHKAMRWTPPLLFGGFVGYYSLGFAYKNGMMAAIDRVAIRVFIHFGGYAGLGAVMPTFQWYSAKIVRITSAVGAVVLYKGVEKIVLVVWSKLKSRFKPHESPLLPVPIDRPKEIILTKPV